MEQNNKFEGWALVELFGHSREAGFVTTEYFGTGALFRVEVPELPEREVILARPEWIDGQLCGKGSKVLRSAVMGRTRFIGPSASHQRITGLSAPRCRQAGRLAVRRVNHGKGKTRMQDVQFFTEQKCLLTLLDFKPKLNKENDKRIRLDFAMSLNGEVLGKAPEAIKDAFYAVSKEESAMNPIGITTEFEGVIANFYATPQTKHASMELSNCTLKQLEVSRPENRVNGDVRLGFHMNVPASQELVVWAYRNYGADVCAVFEEMQPVFPQIKEANPNGDGQGILGMEKQETESTIAKPEPSMSARERAEKVLSGKEEMPRQGKEQKRAVSKIKTAKKAKK